jgi:predicted DNA-binding ribbon-helix-helix protein
MCTQIDKLLAVHPLNSPLELEVVRVFGVRFSVSLEFRFFFD